MPDRLPTALLAVTRALSRPGGFDDVVRTVLAAVPAAVGCERATLYRVEPDGGLRAWSSDGDGRVWGFRLEDGVGLAGWVARHRMPVRSADPAADPRFHALVDEVTGFRTRSVLAVPMLDATDRLVGVLQLLNKPDGFGDDDEELLVALGPACAMALANADLVASLRARNAELDLVTARLKLRTDELEALAGLDRALAAAQDEAVVLHAALDLLVARCGANLADASALLKGERNHVVAAQPDPEGGPAKVRARRISKQWADSLLERFEAPARAGDGEVLQVSAPIVVDEVRVGALQVLVRSSPDDPSLGVVSLVAAAVGRTIAQLRRSAVAARDDRLALVGQMMNGLLHDLRNPLAAITGYVELLAEEPDEAVRADLAARAVRAVMALEAMSQEVLEFTRGATGVSPTEVDARAFVEELTELAGPDLARFRATLAIDGPVPDRLRADAPKLRRVLSNLVRNAGEAGARTVTVRFVAGAGWVDIDVIDDGPGLHAEARDRLFQPFGTFGKPGGTGLGLAMARSIVEAHGGSLEAPTEGGPERGAWFRIRLPSGPS